MKHIVPHFFVLCVHGNIFHWGNTVMFPKKPYRLDKVHLGEMNEKTQSIQSLSELLSIFFWTQSQGRYKEYSTSMLIIK